MCVGIAMPALAFVETSPLETGDGERCVGNPTVIAPARPPAAKQRERLPRGEYAFVQARYDQEYWPLGGRPTLHDPSGDATAEEAWPEHRALKGRLPVDVATRHPGRLARRE
jgi:hypothetical protein